MKHSVECDTVTIRINREDYELLNTMRCKMSAFISYNFSLADTFASLLHDTEIKYGLDVIEYRLLLLNLWLQPEHCEKRVSELDEIIQQKHEETSYEQ